MSTPEQKNTDQSQAQKPVVTLTPAAIDKVISMLEKEDKQGYCLRLGVTSGGCAGLSYDLRFQKEPYENDIVIEQGSVKVLINKESVASLQGTEVDYKDSLKESGFKYQNPKAKNTCSCGISFS